MNNELTLDAGRVDQDRIILPPAQPMFRQVLDYLTMMPDPVNLPSGTGIGREGVAATAISVRWGSYFAVLADRDKPMWSPPEETEETSRICDDEMARINIEASAALAHWIDIFNTDPQLYDRLVRRAVCYLPMPRKTSKRVRSALWPLAIPDIAEQLVAAEDPERLASARADAGQHPSRVLANALVNVAWRNGPIEDIHAGRGVAHPTDRCRVTLAEERRLMKFTADRMADGMDVCFALRSERARHQRSWPEQVLPYRLAHLLLVTPTGWTLTGTSHNVCLQR